MRILRRKLSKEEAILVCERIKLVAIVKPRLYEILDLECDPKDDPLFSTVVRRTSSGQPRPGRRFARKVTAWDPENFAPLELIPLDSTDFEIHWINRENMTQQGELSFRDFAELLPELDYEGVSIWHLGLTEWVPLSRNQTNGSWRLGPRLFASLNPKESFPSRSAGLASGIRDICYRRSRTVRCFPPPIRPSFPPRRDKTPAHWTPSQSSAFSYDHHQNVTNGQTYVPSHLCSSGG